MHDQILIQPDCVFNLLRARRASKNELHEQESLAVGVAVIVLYVAKYRQRFAVRITLRKSFSLYRLART